MRDITLFQIIWTAGVIFVVSMISQINEWLGKNIKGKNKYCSCLLIIFYITRTRNYSYI